MKLVVNGESRDFNTTSVTVMEMLELLGLAQRRVAVEVNRRIVPRASHAEATLSDGDVVEIVQFVGGG